MSALEGAFYSFCVLAVALTPAFFFYRKFMRYEREEFERTNNNGVLEFDSYEQMRRFDLSKAATEALFRLYCKLGGFIAFVAFLFLVFTSYAAFH